MKNETNRKHLWEFKIYMDLRFPFAKKVWVFLKHLKAFETLHSVQTGKRITD